MGFSLISFSSNHIDGWVDWESNQWRFIGIYGHPQAELKSKTWSLVKSICGDGLTPWLVGSDFNAIMFQYEKEGGREKLEVELNDFREAVDACGLVDLGFSDEQFT